MEPLSDVKLEPFEQTWKDWFIVDEPKKKIKLTVFADKARTFYVDPRFNRFKFTGIMKNPELAQYIVCYMVMRDHLKVKTTHGYISILNAGSVVSLFQAILIIKGEKNA